MNVEHSLEVKPWSTTGSHAPGALSEVALLAYPIVLQTVAETAMHVIDTAMIGRLGAVPLSAVGFAGTWTWTLFVPFAGLASGVQVFVSRHDGANEPERCGPWVWQALWLVLPLMAAWMFAIAWFLPGLFDRIGPPANMREAAVSFGLARLFGGPAIAVSYALSSFFRGLGDTRTPLRAALVGIFVNALAAWILIFGHCGAPALGTTGAAIAEAIGSFTICGVLFIAFASRDVRARYRTEPCWPDRHAIARYLRTSVPISGQWLLDMTTFAIFTSIVARMGATSMAASQAMLQLLALSFMQALAISSASGTLIGRYLGAGDVPAATRSFRSSQLLALALSAIVAALFVSVPELLLGIFSEDPDVLSLARPLLALGALFQVIDAIGIVSSGALRGAGDTRWPFALQAALAWGLRLPLVYLLATSLHGGVFGAWAGELIYLAVLTFALVLRFRAGHWRTMLI